MREYAGKFIRDSVEFVDYGLRGAGNALAAPLIWPTVTRILLSNKLFFVGDKEITEYSSAESGGFGLGFLGGLSMDYVLVHQVADEAGRGNYFPLIFLGVSNLVSTGIECVRWFRNRRSLERRYS